MTFVPSLGVKGVVRLLEEFGTAEAVYAAPPSEIVRRSGLREDIARRIADKAGMREAEREAKYCRRHDVRMVASTDGEYPRMLRLTCDYPHVLYFRGDVAALGGRCIAFVGTREMTPYGEKVTTRLIRDLAERMPDTVVVSGLAYGNDSAAHRAALSFGLRTVGVLANALPSIAPVQHTLLAEKMMEEGGAVVTEISSQTPQNGNFFIPRNRIIAGMCAGTVVVESASGGGSLHTARFASDYDRAVMAVPGRVGDKMSVGTNHLIRTSQAQLVASGEDILRELMWDMDAAYRAPQREVHGTASLTPEAECVLRSIPQGDPVSFDALSSACGLAAGVLLPLLTEMELDGIIRQLPGKMYERL